jgi:uncharacterized membrane protein
MPGSILLGVLVAACLLWLAGVLAAPLLAHRDHLGGPLLYAFFHPVCHQIADRSFHLWGEPLAVCHRCLGLYLGFTLGLLAWPAARRPAAWLLERPRRLLIFFAPMAFDVAITFDVAASRFVTGAAAAFPVALFVLVALTQIAARSESLTPLGDAS